MSSQMEKFLYQAAASIFEELGFVFADCDLNKRQKSALFEASAGVVFQGSMCGKVVVQLYGGLLPTLASNMLGETRAPGKTLQRDAFKEIVNVICGNLLPNLAGKKAVFNLRPPRFYESAETIEQNSATAKVQIGLAQGRAEVSLFVDEKL